MGPATLRRDSRSRASFGKEHGKCLAAHKLSVEFLLKLVCLYALLDPPCLLNKMQDLSRRQIL